MNQEVIRRHYLDAMGITAWASRYQLPNALPTEACEWEDAKPASVPPRERLQALLDDAPAPRRASSEAQKPGVRKPGAQKPDTAVASPSAVCALLAKETHSSDKRGSEKPGLEKHGSEKHGQADQANTQPEVTPAVETVPAKPLKFALSCLCVDSRWLVMQAGDMSVLEQRLLANLLHAAGIYQGALPEVTRFTWPPMVNAFAVEDPLDEAREGLAAFIAGQASRQDWKLERLLWWGGLEVEPDTHSGAEQATLGRVLDVTQAHSQTLSLPVWQGPALASLLEGASNKRDLWPALQALGQQWAAGLTDDR